MVDFLIVACREWDFIKYYTQDDDQMRTDLRLVESVGALPLEVGAVLPQLHVGAGGRQSGDGDRVVHHTVLLTQDFPSQEIETGDFPIY